MELRTYMNVLAVWLATLAMALAPAIAADVIFLKQNSEPKYLPDNSGLCDQIYQQLERRLIKKDISIVVDPQFYPVKRLMKMLETDQGHVFCGAGVTEERKLTFHYSELSLYQVSNVILSHADETEIPTSFAEIADKEMVIGSFYGTSSSAWLKQQPRVLVSDNYVSLDQVVQMVAHEKGLKYFFYHDLGLNYYVRISGEPLRVLPTKYRTIPQKMLYSRELPTDIRQEIEKALNDMVEEGVLADIQRQFFNH